MKERYIIYANDYTGYKILNVVYDIESAKDIVDNLNENIYLSYIIIKHNIIKNSKEVFDFGFLDYQLNRRRVKK